MDQAKLFLSSFGGGGPGGDPGDPIDQSLRFRGSNSILRRAAGFDSGNANAYTFSTWVKLGKLPHSSGDYQLISNAHSSHTSGSFIEYIAHTSDDLFRVFYINGSGAQYDIKARGNYRDPSAWYHVVVAIDTNQSAEADRARIYVNGVDRTNPNSSFPALGAGVHLTSGNQLSVGIESVRNRYNLDGYLAETYFIDGQALEPTVFGRYNANDVWVPVAPQGLTFESNGFYLDYSDPNDIGADRSPNGNDFTPSGFDTVPPAAVTGTYADPSVTTFSGGEFPTGVAGLDPYWVDCNPASALASQSGVQSMSITFNGELDYVSGYPNSPQWYGTQYANNVLSVNFDLRDFTADGVTSVQICDSYSASNPRPYSVWLLDASKTKIPGSDWVYDSSLNGQFQTVPVPAGSAPAFIHFDCEGTQRILALAGIRINDIWINQTPGSGNPDYDLMQDSPTQNYATLNPLAIDSGNDGSFADANLGIANGILNTASTAGMPPDSGVYYFEGTYISHSNSGDWMGITPDTPAALVGGGNNNITGWYWVNTNVFNWVDQGVFPGETIPVPSLPATYGWEYDSGAHTLKVHYNGSVIKEFTGLPSVTFYASSKTDGSINGQTAYNFGQQPFQNQPAGTVALQTQNMPAAPIANGRDHFQAITGPGTATGGIEATDGSWSDDLTGVSATSRPSYAFTADSTTSTSDDFGTLVWEPEGGFDYTEGFKVGLNHQSNNWGEYRVNDGPWIDNNASLGNISNLQTGGTVIATGSGTINKFEVRQKSTQPDGYRKSAIMAFATLQSGTWVQLLDSPILSQAQNTFPNGLWWIKDRVNSNQHQLLMSNPDFAFTCPQTALSGAYTPPAGDSVAWCWNNADPARSGFQLKNGISEQIADQRFDHDLGVEPEFIIALSGQTTVAQYHPVYHKDAIGWLQLNDAAAQINPYTNLFPTITSTQVGLSTMSIAYAGDPVALAMWRSVPGYSAFGSVSSGQDSFAYTGFRPAFLLTKQTDTSGDWLLWDTARDINNPSITVCIPNGTQGEENGGTQQVDLLSNGIKFRGTAGSMSGNLIWAAFAENPFSSPVTAR